jgi:outer membrane immunogenic protein
MKKLVLALSAVAAFSGSAIAADLPARAYTKAPAVVATVPTWTGCYLGGGGGFGMWNQENTGFIDGPPVRQFEATTTAGGRGYFGTVQAGCDYQFGGQFVVGAFGDYDFSSLKANVSPTNGLFGEEKMSSAWSVGGRAGWLVTPSLLVYFSGGYTEATFDRVNLSGLAVGAPTNVAFFNKRTYKGWFLGAGDEYALSFLPGLFWKTEYRFSRFDTENNSIRDFTTGGPDGFSIDSRKFVQTVRSELVYRFNWGSGAVVAKY